MPPSRCVPAVWWICNSNVTTAKDGGCKIYPKKYLQASFEVFLSMLVVSWAATLAFNTDIVESNRIKDVFGYNNVCVGFDMEPAKYFAQPLFALQAFYGIRYVSLDNLRAELNLKIGDPRKGWSHWYTKTSNNLFMVTMLLWGALLILPPMGDTFTFHFYIYAIFVVVMYQVILANFVEAYQDGDHVSRIGYVWCAVFGGWTLFLLIFGTVGFNGYDYERCPNHSFAERDEMRDEGILEHLCTQKPTIPIKLMSLLDHGWFVLLALTPFMLPDSPPIVYTGVKLQNAAAKAAERVRIMNDQL